MVIDFRLRPPYKSFTRLSIYGLRDTILSGRSLPRHALTDGMETWMPKSVAKLSVELMLSEMDEAGMTHGCVLGRQAGEQYGSVSNDEVFELCTQYPKRLIPFAGIDPSKPREATQEIDRTVKGLGFKGVSIDPGWLNPPCYCDDNLLFPVYDMCQALNIPVCITTSVLGGPDLEYSNPVRIQRVAQSFPRLNVVVSHGAFPWVTQALGVALHCSNVWVSPDFYHFVPGMPGAQEWVDAANSYLDERFLFGSGYPIRPLKLSVEQFCRFNFLPKVLENCLWRNAARLLKLSA